MLDTIASQAPTQGALLLYKIQIVSLDNRPLKLTIVAPTTRPQSASAELDAQRLAFRPASSTSARATGGAKSPPGAVFDEQHADYDPGRRARANDANQASVLLASLSASPRSSTSFDSFEPASLIRWFRPGGVSCTQSPVGRAGLARDRHAGDRGRGAGAFAHDADHHAAGRSARPRRPSRVRARRRRVRRERRRGRRPPSAIVAATIAICSALAYPVPVRSPSSRRRVRPGCLDAAGACSPAPPIPGGWLKPKRSGHRDGAAARRA